MTIEKIDTYGSGVKASCVWFDGSDRLTDLFVLETLIKYEDDHED